MQLKDISFLSNTSIVIQSIKRILKTSFSVLGMLLLWFVSAQAISFAQDPYPSDADEIKWRQVNVTKEDLLNKAINTLDLGEYKTETSSIRPNINAQGGGLDYRSQSNGTLFTLSSKYNERNGLSFGGVLATPISKNTALGVLLNAGSDRNEWLVNAGWDIDERQRVIGTLGQLRQKLDFSFISGVEKAQITQNNAALSYQYLLGRTLLNSAELNAYISDTQSLNLADKTFYTDTASLYELWNDPRRIAGGRVEGFQGRMVFTPNSRSTFKLGLGAEKLSYDLLVGKENYLRATGSAELNQLLSNGLNLTAAANLAASQDKFLLGLSKTFNDGYQLGVNVAAIRGRDNTFDDNQLTINFTQFLGAAKSGVQALNFQALNAQDSAVKTAATDSTPKVFVDEVSEKPKAQWTSSLVNAVSKRPTFLPSQVNAKVDASATPTRLIAIDKTQIPTGSTIDKASGVLSIPIRVSGVDVPVSAIASVTKNAGVFTNSGQFALSGSTYLVINPNLIMQPATTDTYVVTMNNTTGGGATLATITLSHSSIKIDSVVISSGTIATVLSNFAVPSQTYGAAAFTLTPPTTNNLSGAFTYTSTNTSVATISGTTVTLVGAGSTVITATQAANGNYASSSTTTTLTVTAAINNNAAILGVTPPVSGATPVTTTTAGTGYIGTVTWSPSVSGTFSYNTVYTATVTLTAESGYTLAGVAANYFLVNGATATNPINSGVVTAVFPSTDNINIGAIDGVTPPVSGATPVTTTTAGTGYIGTVTWSPSVSGTFAYNTVYTATVTLTAESGYTLAGVAANYFLVNGATATNPINSGVVTAVFPSTGTLVTDFIVSGGLTWTRNDTQTDWANANSICAALTAQGLPAGSWRLPTLQELSGLYNAGTAALGAAGWELDDTWTADSAGAGRHYFFPLSSHDPSTFNAANFTFLDREQVFMTCVH